MNKKGNHDTRFYRALMKVMDAFKEEKGITKRELRRRKVCNPTTLNAILKYLVAIKEFHLKEKI
jgi:hypothetical protein